MKVTFGYQYFDSDPDEIQKEGNSIDSIKAVELFNTFPWDKQFEGILKRKECDLSSTTPRLYFYETEEQFLSISATNDEGFLIHFRENHKLGELFISNNILEKPEGISVEQFIDDFFNHEVGETLALFEFELGSPKEVRYKLEYKKGKLYRPLLFILLPFVYLFFDPTIMFPIILTMSGIIFLFTLPKLLLNLSYWKNDSNQTINYKPTKKLLTIKNQNKTYEILKSEIESLELVQPRTSQGAFQEYSYLRFRSGDLAFAVTHLTIEPRELLSLLNINFRVIEVLYPRLQVNLITEEEKKKRQCLYDQKRSEFIETYTNWDTKKLEEVIVRTDYYADYARSAACEILERRKNS